MAKRFSDDDKAATTELNEMWAFLRTLTCRQLQLEALHIPIYDFGGVLDSYDFGGYRFRFKVNSNWGPWKHIDGHFDKTKVREAAIPLQHEYMQQISTRAGTKTT